MFLLLCGKWECSRKHGKLWILIPLRALVSLGLPPVFTPKSRPILPTPRAPGDSRNANPILTCQIEPSAPDTQAQNGAAERSGGVIKDKARAMRLDANLPWQMWPEIVRSAVYLFNRTPRYGNGWKTPHEVFFTTAALRQGMVTKPKKPNQAHLRVYGCKAFALSDDTKRGKYRLQRLEPRAWIGYLQMRSPSKDSLQIHGWCHSSPG